MTLDRDIAMNVETDIYNETCSEQLIALLLEIQDMLKKLVDSGEHGYVDLQELNLPARDVQQLKLVLGTGDVQATVYELGLIQISETGISGVWWVTHKDASNEILSDVIEVTTLPEILVTQHQDLHESVGVLQERLQSLQEKL